ncbi:Protein PsbN [Dirofilaria immitis]
MKVLKLLTISILILLRSFHAVIIGKKTGAPKETLRIEKRKEKKLSRRTDSSKNANNMRRNTGILRSSYAFNVG